MVADGHRDAPSRLLVFRVGAELFGVVLSAVREVVDAPEVRAIPDAPAAVLGVTSLHGQIVTVFDAHPLLRVGAGHCGAALIFDRGDRQLAIGVSDVLDTLDVGPHQMRTISGMDTSDGVLQGVVRRDRDLVAVVNADALIRRALADAEDRS